MKTTMKNTQATSTSCSCGELYKQIYDMQTRLLKELDEIGRLPKDDPRRIAYGKKVRQQQIDAGIITPDNKLTKAFGG
ncbi:MAG: hypothetical protein ACOX9C_11400 [Kiritimatiellia bacterium]|jgi:hypothetical protein